MYHRDVWRREKPSIHFGILNGTGYFYTRLHCLLGKPVFEILGHTSTDTEEGRTSLLSSITVPQCPPVLPRGGKTRCNLGLYSRITKIPTNNNRVELDRIGLIVSLNMNLHFTTISFFVTFLRHKRISKSPSLFLDYNLRPLYR